MKLLQLNVWGGKLDRQIEDLLKQENPDILCLQEAIDLKGGRASLFITTDEIQELLKAPHIFSSPVFSLKYMNRKADFGNAIISKFPITNTKTIFTGKEYIDDFDALNHGSNARNLQHAVISLPDDRDLNILNHHGYHVPQHKKGDDESRRQCQIIADYLKALTGPIILAGDFNLEPDSSSLALINDLLTNLPVKYGLETTRTPLTHKTEVCDYIFTSKEIRISAFRASDEIVSDHQALILDFS